MMDRNGLEARGLDPERAALAHEIWHLNQRVHDRMMALVGPSEVPLGLTPYQLQALSVVVADPGMTSQDLAGRLEISAPTATKLIDRLIEKGVIERRRDEHDGRIRRLNATERGLQATREGDSLLERTLVALVELMSLDDMETLKRSSQTMLDVISRLSRPVA